MYLRTKNSYMPRTEDGTESPPITAMQMDNSVCVAGISAAENGRAILYFAGRCVDRCGEPEFWNNDVASAELRNRRIESIGS